ncbi:MAG: hypothetical protein U0793_08560 [Gemmataceae bacterium]
MLGFIAFPPLIVSRWLCALTPGGYGLRWKATVSLAALVLAFGLLALLAYWAGRSASYTSSAEFSNVAMGVAFVFLASEVFFAFYLRSLAHESHDRALATRASVYLVLLLVAVAARTIVALTMEMEATSTTRSSIFLVETFAGLFFCGWNITLLSRAQRLVKKMADSAKSAPNPFIQQYGGADPKGLSIAGTFRRWWKRVLVGLLVTGLIALAVNRYRAWRLNRELEEVIAELDRTEPGWRLDDVERSRKSIPNDKNGALIVTEAIAKAPTGWRDDPLWLEFEERSPPLRLPAEKARDLRAALLPVSDAIAEAQKLQHFPEGRFPITYAPNLVGTLVPHLRKVRETVRLLHADAIMACEDGDPARVYRDCLAALNASQTLASEPLLISQIVRMETHHQAVRDMERALAQAEGAPETLAAARKTFTSLANDNMLLTSLRGERGGFHMLLNNAFDCEIMLAELTGENKATLADHVGQFFSGNMIHEANIYMLRHFTRAIAAAQLPDAQKDKAFVDLEMEMKSGAAKGEVSKLASLLMPAFRKVCAAEQSCRAHLACARIGLAAEEYRLKHKRWPASTKEIFDAGLFLDTPLDPFNGEPLRWRETEDGLVIYSVGPHGDYAGDALDEGRPRKDDFRVVEFRLWNVNRRRQAAADVKR